MVFLEEAMVLALEYCAMHHSIELDRHTLLKARLVCRDWRNSAVFSGKITSVTLHRLADVQLVTHFFSGTPVLRSPWRRLEDTSVFPNLRTLKLPEHLCLELPGSAEGRWWLRWDCGGFDVKVTEINGQNVKKLTPFLSRMRRISSLHITGDRFQFLSDVINLSGLKKLVLESTSRFDGNLNINCLSALNSLPSLTHLELTLELSQYERADTNSLTQFKAFLHVISTLTRLTCLDFSVDLCTTNSNGLTEVRSMLQGFAPGMPYTCEVDQYWSEAVGNSSVEYHVQVQYSPSQGSHISDSHLDLWIDHANDNVTVSGKLQELLAHGIPSDNLAVDLTVDVALPCEVAAIDLTGIGAVESVTVELKYCWSEPEMPDRQISVFTCQPGVCLPTTSLEMCVGTTELGWQPSLFYSSVLGQIPQVFPHLLSMTFNTDYNCILNSTNSLRELTNLTCLTLGAILTPNGHLTSLSCLPTSLKSLEIHLMNTSTFPVLQHLTYLCLHIVQYNVGLESLYSCGAPLKELHLGGTPSEDRKMDDMLCHMVRYPQVEVDLQALVAAFPLLEVLGMRVDYCDVSPLSRLTNLRALTLLFFNDEITVADFADWFVGVHRLTALQELELPIESTECLDELGTLTQLRHLHFTIRVTEPELPEMGEPRLVKETLQRLRASLPHTHVQHTTYVMLGYDC